MERISVVGSTGSGKTTFARMLARSLDLPFVELDALFWEPEWRPASPERFRSRAFEAMRPGRWVVDGNYGGTGVREMVWARADTIVWLDFPFAFNLWRLLRRTMRRIRSGEEQWSGNRESARNAFFSRDSLILYLVTTHRRRRRQFAAAMESPEYAHVRWLVFRSPAEAERWLASVGA